MKSLTVVLAMLVATFSFSQGGLGGPPGGGPGQDGNAWNPANWNTAYSIEYDGEDVAVNWINHPMLGPTEYIVSQDWSDLWAMPEGAYNSTGLSKTVRYSSSGTTKITIKWTSPYPTPSKVLVKIISNAGYYFASSGSGVASNGIGSSTVEMNLSPMTTGVASGSKLQYISINGSGEGVIELEKSASAESSGIGSWAGAHALGFTVEIADRAVEILPWITPTYRKVSDPHQGILRVENVNLDPTDKQMDVGILPTNWNNLEHAWRSGPSPTILETGAWGPWHFQLPFQTTALWDTGETTFPSYRSFPYTYDEVLGLVSGSESKTATVTATDHVDGVSRSASLVIRFHSVAENITATSDERVYSSWQRVSNEEVMFPQDSDRWLERTTGVVAAVTKKVMNELGGEVGATIKGVLQVKVAGKRQWGQDETAQISHTLGTRYLLQAREIPVKYWIERKAYWRVKWGWCDVYLQDGFAGIDVWHYTYWESGTKALAEEQDFQQAIREEEYEEQE